MTTANDIFELLSYPKGVKLNLERYEIELIRDNAKKYLKGNTEELERLEKFIKEDCYWSDHLDTVIYNLYTKEVYSLKELMSMYKIYDYRKIMRRIKNKECIGMMPYSLDENDNPLFYSLKSTKKALYRCKVLDRILSIKEWKEYFKDNKFKACYHTEKQKYKNKYAFEKCNYFYEVLEYYNQISKEEK